MGRLVVAATVSLWVIPISILVNRIVPEPYMDEIFHVPQAQQYCNGNFRNWDPMITTPPGLYYLSLAHVASLFPGMLLTRTIHSFSEACSSVVLRSTNGFLAVLCSVLFYEIITCLRPGIGDRNAAFIAIVMALYPLHWFFTFLYYTDAASLFMVLAMYYMSLKKKYMLSALFGAVSVFVRQTNIIWVFFVACTGVIEITLANNTYSVEVEETNVRADQSSERNDSVTSSNLRRRKRNSTANTQNNHIVGENSSSQAPASGLFSEFRQIIQNSWLLKQKILISFSPFFIVFMAFVAFLRWNGGIVLGAKDAHVVSIHFAQILYFGLVSVLFMLPTHIKMLHVRDLCRTFRENLPLSLLLGLSVLVVGFLAVHFFSIAHPYLLADNRHYTFYLWRKVVNTHWSTKYLLVPAYGCSWFSILRILAKTRRKIWALAYFLATAAVLIPAPLIELRYFTIPFYFFVLHSGAFDYRSWIITGALYASVNVFTMAMFLFRPFLWSHEPGTQRFIW